jgi:hypothetical protein
VQSTSTVPQDRPNTSTAQSESPPPWSVGVGAGVGACAYITLVATIVVYVAFKRRQERKPLQSSAGETEFTSTPRTHMYAGPSDADAFAFQNQPKNGIYCSPGDIPGPGDYGKAHTQVVYDLAPAPDNLDYGSTNEHNNQVVYDTSVPNGYGTESMSF